ncbi:uncharacterized protein PAC_18363 [Phialocephala subalpina]|uniref:Heterokaryon incompatibility domain-containing protein n=1 Tax=Phialocephala subalpina TaxID=576137 RepID=A0A1L7XTW1_9HELO|nr:uncharacterized protein PAC_18363 [Phialocephala subalpina]
MKSIRDKWSRQKQPRLHAVSAATSIQLSKTSEETTQVLDEFSKTFLSLNENTKRDAYTSDDSTSRSDSEANDDQFEFAPILSDTAGQLVRLQQGLAHRIAVSTTDDRLLHCRQARQGFGGWFCRVCGSVEGQHPSLDDIESLGWIRRSVAFAALRSGRSKCNLCYVIVEAILAFYKQNMPPEESPMSVKIDCWPGHHCKLMVEGPYQHRRGESLSIYAQEAELQGLPYIPSGCQAVLDLRLKANVSIIERWISDSIIRDEQNASILPLRVLDVGTGGQTISLLETHSDCGLYTTLSHCWGKTLFITTTTATLPTRMEGIQLSDLPRTFLEAVMITRLIGLRYLWIDSLCIIQDSTTDWETQSSLMGDIFSNSYVTIAAAGASDSSHGCLMECLPDRQTVEFTCSIGEAPKVQLFVGRHMEPEEAPGFHGDLPQHLLSMPLCTRGWTMQELMLSPRILYFTGDDVFWECRQGLQCHCPVRHVWNLSSIKSTLIGHKTRFSYKEPELCFKEWRELVENYSQRFLTKQTDVLPALSGIARRHQSLHNSPYLAGLWEIDLLVDLFWSRPIHLSDKYWYVEVQTRLTRPYPSCAPSWSWASVKGPVNWQNKDLPDEFERPAKLIKAISTVGNNPWGQPLSSQLLMQGILINVDLDIHHVSDQYTMRRCQIRFDSRCWMGLEQATLDVDDFADHDRFAVFMIGMKTVPFEVNGTNDMRKLRQSGIELDDLIISHRMYYYLVLKRVPGTPRHYQRVGIFIKTVKAGEKWSPGDREAQKVITLV